MVSICGNLNSWHDCVWWLVKPLLCFRLQAVRLVFIPNTSTPALVQSVGLTKLDISLPSPVSESFHFVFETNTFSLDAILPKYSQIDLRLNQEEKEDFVSSAPISHLFAVDTDCEKKSGLYGISQFSAWVSYLTLFLFLFVMKFLNVNIDFIC